MPKLMPIFKVRARFALLLIIALIGLSIYYASDIEQTNVLTPPSATKKPNAFAQGTTLKEYDEQGELRLHIEADKSYFYKSEDYIETSNPRITYRNEADEVILLNAVHGHYQVDQGILNLSDKVSLKRTPPQGDALTLNTQDLIIDTENDFISTERNVSIKQGSNSLSSQGIKASLNDRKIELKQDVRGRYELAN